MLSKDEFNKQCGANLKRLRKLKKMTQGDLARQVGMERTSIVNIECGRQALTAYVAAQICEILSCSYDSLFPPLETEHTKILKLENRIANDLNQLFFDVTTRE